MVEDSLKEEEATLWGIRGGKEGRIIIGDEGRAGIVVEDSLTVKGEGGATLKGIGEGVCEFRWFFEIGSEGSKGC